MATPPKKKGTVRVTLSVPKSQRVCKPGRPKGCLKKREFDDFRLGCMMKYATPLEYDIIIKSLPSGPFKLPDPDVIRAVAKASGNRILNRMSFFQALEMYEKSNGILARRFLHTKKRIEYYTKMKIAAERYFYLCNRKRIKSLKKKKRG